MWVCICHGIRCRDVRDAAGNGAARAGDVFRRFEVRVRCGKCVPTICNLLNEGKAVTANEGCAAHNNSHDEAPAPIPCCAAE